MKRTIVIAVTSLMLAYSVSARSVTHWQTPANLQVSTFRLNDKEQKRVASAIDVWRPFLPSEIMIQLAGEANAIQTCQGCVIIVRQSVSGDERGEAQLSSLDGLTTNVIIRIDPRAGSGDQFQRVVEHELGHALGLNHRDKSIMAWKNPRRHPSLADAAELLAVYRTTEARTEVVTSIAQPAPVTDTINDQQSSASEPVRKYSFRRIVTRGKQRRESVFTYDDQGRQVETEIVGDNIKVPAIPIGRDVTAQWAASPALKAFTVTWTDEAGIVQTQDRPWFKEGTKSGLKFPAEASNGKVHVKFSDYKLFRVSVSVRELN